MTSYDFNATYGPLRVYNQESEGACVNYAIDTATAAQVLMHTGHLPVWPDDGASYPRLTQGGFVGSDYIDYYVTMDGVTYALRNPGTDPDQTPEHMKAVLLASGVSTLGVVAVASFVNPPLVGGLPVVRPLASDSSGQGHDCVAVGFTDAGLIVQNSYGVGWGSRGRAVLSWEWLALHGTGLTRYQVDDYPLDGATKTPQPLKEDKMLLARRTSASPVFMIVGGQRSWIPSSTVMYAQGYTWDDVKVIPDDGSPASSIYRLPMTGPQPPHDN